MFDTLFKLFKTNNLSKFTSVLVTMDNVMTIFEQEFKQDGNAKNAAIDTIIQLLENHKSK